MAYFDWNATAPLLPAARTAWQEAADRAWGNPSAPYRTGIAAKRQLDASRSEIAKALEVDQSSIIFTSGASESNNAFLRMAAEKSGHDSEVWISSIEHPSVREACAHYWGPARVIQMPVSRNGALDLDWLADRLKTERPALVCLMAVNNETGVIQPVDTVLDLCQSRGIPLYCDAVQWFGKGAGPLAQHMEGLSFSLSAHKFGGLKGTGCLVLGQQWSGSKFQYGGGQESGARGGTEDVPGIAAMATALSNRLQPLNSSAKAARDAFEEQLAALWPDVVIHGKATARVWNTSYVSLPQFHANRWISRLDRKGFEVSSGAACSSSNGSTSAVLRAMCVADAVAARAVRISAGWETAPGKWAGLLVALEEVRQELGKAGQHSGPGTVIEI